MAISVPAIGPRHILIGNPTTALGAGMLAVGLVRNVNLSRSPNIKVGTSVTGAENHEAKYYLNTELTVQFEVSRNAATGIRTFIESIDSSNDYLTLGEAMSKITIAIVDPADAASGTASTSTKTLWVPSVRLEQVGDESYNADQAGPDDSNFVMLTFKAGYVATDQDSNAVPEEALPDVPGDRLSSHSLSTVWFLPSPYGATS